MTGLGWVVSILVVGGWIFIHWMIKMDKEIELSKHRATARMFERRFYEIRKSQGYQGTFDDYMAWMTGRKDWWNDKIYGYDKWDQRNPYANDKRNKK